jgi:6-phosphogluconate dehydrogenase
MQIRMIGLGRSGASMVTRQIHGQHECMVHDQSLDGIARLVAYGTTGAVCPVQLALQFQFRQPPAVCHAS